MNPPEPHRVLLHRNPGPPATPAIYVDSQNPVTGVKGKGFVTRASHAGLVEIDSRDDDRILSLESEPACPLRHARRRGRGSRLIEYDHRALKVLAHRGPTVPPAARSNCSCWARGMMEQHVGGGIGRGCGSILLQMRTNNLTLCLPRGGVKLRSDGTNLVPIWWARVVATW